jgi:hypothetical protein
VSGVHREAGLTLSVDLGLAFWNGRRAPERARLAAEIRRLLPPPPPAEERERGRTDHVCHDTVVQADHPAPASGEPSGCLNDAPCPPFTSHGASIRQPFGPGAPPLLVEGARPARAARRPHRSLGGGTCGVEGGHCRPVVVDAMAGVGALALQVCSATGDVEVLPMPTVIYICEACSCQESQHGLLAQ